MRPFPAERSATLLAAVGGYVDTLGFIALFGLFTAHVTGNFVLIGAELARPGQGVLLKFLAFPTFVLAVVLARLIALVQQRRGRPALGTLFAAQVLFLLAFMAAGLAAEPVQRADQPWVMAAGLLGVMAMGLQNGTGRLLLGKLTPHTVMTGNVTQLVLELTDAALGLGDAASRPRLARLLGPVLAFGGGAIAGALGFMACGFWALLPAALVVAWLGWCGIEA